MILVGLDPGTLLGWAVVDGDTWTSGVWSLKGRAHEGAGMRFIRARASLAELIETVKPDVVAYEQSVAFRSRQATEFFGGLFAVIEEECERRGVPYIGITQAVVKKVATGKGNAGKPAMIAAARERWSGWEPQDDNEVDARWVAVAALLEVGSALPEHEQAEG